MTTTEELRVTVTGPEAQIENYVHTLKKTIGEAERHGITINVERVNTEQMDTEFTTADE